MNIILIANCSRTLHVTLKKTFPLTQNVINHSHAIDFFSWTLFSKSEHPVAGHAEGHYTKISSLINQFLLINF